MDKKKDNGDLLSVKSRAKSFCGCDLEALDLKKKKKPYKHLNMFLKILYILNKSEFTKVS